MKKNTLLVITSAFPNNSHEYEGIFIKEQLKFLKNEFKSIYVIRPQYYIPGYLDFFGIIPKSWKIKPDRKQYSFGNIIVFFPRVSIIGFLKFRQIRNFILTNNIKFDLIHSHFIYPSGEIGNYLKKIFKVKHISSARGSEIRIPLSNIKSNIAYKVLLKYKLKKILYSLDYVTTSHEELRDLLMKKYSIVLKNKFLFFNKGLDLSRFNSTSEKITKEAQGVIQEYKLNNKFIVLFIGNLNDFKDPLMFTKAALDLKDEKDIVFLLVGDGEMKDRIQQFKVEYNLHNLLLLGVRNDTEVIYSLSHVFCALSPYENIWSNTVIESLCMGVPLIVTDSGYTRESLSREQGSVLIPAKDAGALAKEIKIFKNDCQYRLDMSYKAYNFGIKNFDDSENIKNLTQLYGKFLK